MPIYEYKCTECGHIIEAFQKANDPPLKKCTKCGGILKKVLSSPAIQFKGTGWYITDYAQNKDLKKEEKKAEKPKPTKTESPKEKKGEGTADRD